MPLSSAAGPLAAPVAGAEGRGQRPVQRGIHEVAAHMRIHSRRAIRLMTHVDLDETAVDSILGEMTDVGMPQAMDDQGGRETEGLTVGDEPGIDLRRLHPPAALGYPQRRMTGAPEPGP